MSVVLFFIALWPAYGLTKATTEDSYKANMHAFYAELVNIKPLLTSPEQFADNKNTGKIRQSLAKLKSIARSTKDSATNKGTPTYRLSLAAFTDHIRSTERTFLLGNKEYARHMLKASTALCVSCHTQVPQGLSPTLSVSSDQFATARDNDFGIAEFYYVTRRFDQALRIYDKLIRSFPANNLSLVELNDSLRRKLTIFARIKRNPQQAIESLDRDLLNKQLPFFVIKNIQAWKRYCKDWKNDKDPDPAKTSTTKLISFAKKRLAKSRWDRAITVSDPHAFNYLRISGLLYEHLYRQPISKYTPELLYLLGQCEKHLNNEFYQPLSELYLKECIRLNPSHPIAKACYREYEDSLNLAYQSTTGLVMPTEVRKELVLLKKSVGL